MSSIVSILLAILVISVVIIFHELGHFLLAKANGIVVTEFSLGMGPRLVSFEKKGTRYSWKLFPIGGSCMMLGEEEGSDKPGTFNSKTVWQRISVVFAGPFFNFILAFVFACIILGYLGYDKPFVYGVTEEIQEETGLQAGDVITEYEGHKIRLGRELALYTQLDGISEKEVTITYVRDGKEYQASYQPIMMEQYYIGIQYVADEKPMELTDVIAKGAAQEAGMKAGDILTAMNGEPIASGKAFTEYVEAHPLGKEAINVTYTRDGAEYTATVTPHFESSYSLGFSCNYIYRERISAPKVLQYGLYEVKYWITTTVKSLGYMIRGKASSEDIGGPVRIVDEMSNVVEESYHTDGFLYAYLNLLNWAILLSANLGVMNLLPIPALDGGRLLFLLVEAVIRKRLSPEKEGIINVIGFALLMLLMVFIFVNDIRNLF